MIEGGGLRVNQKKNENINIRHCTNDFDQSPQQRNFFSRPDYRKKGQVEEGGVVTHSISLFEPSFWSTVLILGCT